MTKHRKDLDDTKTGVSPPCPGSSMEGTYLPAVRCPVYSGMTLIRAFVRNLRTGSVMQIEKAQVGGPTRPKVPMH